MPFSFLQRGNLADHARQLTLGTYKPELTLQGLLTGVDNLRHDVFLSPRFVETARQHISKLIAKYAQVEDLLAEEPQSTFRPPSVITKAADKKPAPKPGDAAELKRMLAELAVVSLNRAKADSNPSIDLLARLAVSKFLRAELDLQFKGIQERCGARVKSMEGPRQAMPAKAVQMRERFYQLQVGKKAILRRVAQDLFQTFREIEKETLARMRRSLFGDSGHASYDLFLNRLLFTEDGRDDFLNAEHYVMLGNYDHDVDRFHALREIACDFLKSLGVLKEGEQEGTLDELLNVPENAQELVGGGAPDDSPKGKAQKAILGGWRQTLESEGVMEYVIAAYEVVPLLAQYSPPINAQQLKNAIVAKDERKRVEKLLEDHGKMSPDALHAAIKKAGNADRDKVAGRFLGDFIRYHRDLRRLECLNAAMDAVNVITNERLRELSSINNTLYEFLLPEEQKPTEDKVVHHVILKADVRESTTVTRTLFERGLNPASYFSLNFYDPINKLLPHYGATKVFIEGDAVILALMEREGEQAFCASRMCVLAKEMIGIVRAYNQKSQEDGLPVLELGLGISYQDSAPMYLMDGNSRIMISKALNESDRLSACTKGAKKYLGSMETPFHVFSFQTVDDADTGGAPDEFLVRYNIGGIHINTAAFEKVKQEISLAVHEIAMPNIWGQKKVRLYSGMVPMLSGTFQKLVLREGAVPHIDARDLTLKEWTARRYYEVCTSKAIYDLIESRATAATAD